MGIKFTNNAIGTLASGIGTGDLTIVLTAGQGALFPTYAAGEYSFARLKKATNQNEIVKITARSTDTLTVTRAQDGTSALTFSAGDEIRITWPRAALEAVRDEARGPAAVDTITGNIVLTSADKLKQKVVTATATITLPAATDLATGEWIDFKSLTTGLVKIVPAGADTLDGDGSATPYRLPSFCTCRVMKSGTGAFILAIRPDVEVGDVVWWPVASATPKKGFLFADNVAENRTTYAGLFDVYGTTHGAGDGSTTFGKPDVRGRVPVGRDDMGGAAASRITAGVSGIAGTAVGAAGGDQRRPAHSHGVTDPGHFHTLNEGAVSPGGGSLYASGDDITNSVATTQNTDTKVTNISVNSDGAGTAENVQPSIVGNYLVKT